MYNVPFLGCHKAGRAVKHFGGEKETPVRVFASKALYKAFNTEFDQYLWKI
jgi:hypothetical protein